MLNNFKRVKNPVPRAQGVKVKLKITPPLLRLDRRIQFLPLDCPIKSGNDIFLYPKQFIPVPRAQGVLAVPLTVFLMYSLKTSFMSVWYPDFFSVASFLKKQDIIINPDCSRNLFRSVESSPYSFRKIVFFFQVEVFFSNIQLFHIVSFLFLVLSLRLL